MNRNRKIIQIVIAGMSQSCKLLKTITGCIRGCYVQLFIVFHQSLQTKCTDQCLVSLRLLQNPNMYIYFILAIHLIAYPKITLL